VEIIEALIGRHPSMMREQARGEDAPVWTKWHEAFKVIAYPAYLAKTLRIAAIFGSILFAINHLDEVLLGRATSAVWIKGALTFLVPFCVSNLGVLVASRRRVERKQREIDFLPDEQAERNTVFLKND